MTRVSGGEQKARRVVPKPGNQRSTKEKSVEKATPVIRQKRVEHKAFAQRMHQACDGNSSVPLPNYGRLQWFVDQFEAKFGIETTPESVRKWFAGEALPRPKTMTRLAQILEVDEAWLSLGKAVELDQRQQRLRNAEADGVVNVVAGLIQMCGANPAFPEPDDRRAEREHIDVYAIIRGAQYAIHVVLAADTEDSVRFAVPVEAIDTFVVGVVRTSDLTCDFYEIDRETLDRSKRKGGFIEVNGIDDLVQIRTFGGATIGQMGRFCCQALPGLRDGVTPRGGPSTGRSCRSRLLFAD